MTQGFGYVGGFDHFNFGDHKKLKKLITKKTADKSIKKEIKK